jgi:mono/diheme cytochrome c family protein
LASASPACAVASVGALALVIVAAAVVYAAGVLRTGFSTRDAPSEMEALVARTARNLAMPRQMRELKNPLAADPSVLEDGREHFADHCAMCHGNDGRGDTPIGRGLYPRAPDMTRRETQDLTDGEIYAIIQNGIRLSGMPAWGEPGEHDHGTWALVAFIRHLPRITPDELSAMEELNPRSRAELLEELEEEEFLRGGGPVKHPTERDP